MVHAFSGNMASGLRISESTAQFISINVVQNGQDQSSMSDAISDIEGYREYFASPDTVLRVAVPV